MALPRSGKPEIPASLHAESSFDRLWRYGTTVPVYCEETQNEAMGDPAESNVFLIWDPFH